MRTRYKVFAPPAESVTVTLSPEEMVLIVRGLSSMEMFASPTLITNDHSSESFEKWFAIRSLLGDLAIPPKEG